MIDLIYDLLIDLILEICGNVRESDDILEFEIFINDNKECEVVSHLS